MRMPIKISLGMRRSCMYLFYMFELLFAFRAQNERSKRLACAAEALDANTK